MFKKRLAAVLALIILLAVGIFFGLHGKNFEVLNPKGIVASREKTLMLVTLALSLLVVVPVFAMTFGIAYKYRATNTKAKYSPNWDHSVAAETAWWAIPGAIIFILSMITWNSAHALDPYKPLANNGTTPINVQVVALDWKWLFIYPDYKVASINQLEMPVNTPVNLTITADAPMNSLWIPQLGGQIYAMPGMMTQLHLEADHSGSYHGSSANISGAGFAGMTFTAQAASANNFSSWINRASQAPNNLNWGRYQQLAKDSQNNPVQYFKLADTNIMNEVMDKYMMPSNQTGSSSSMSGMSM